MTLAWMLQAPTPADSMVATTLPDTTGIAGWIDSVVTPLVRFLPGPWAAIVVGFAIMVTIDLLQVFLKAVAPGVAKYTGGLWGRFVNPILAIVLSLPFGNPVIAAVAAGLRSMIFKGNSIEKTRDAVRSASDIGRTAALVGALGLMAALASPVFAADVPAASPRWQERVHSTVGVVTPRWETQKGLMFRAAVPEVGARFRLTYQPRWQSPKLITQADIDRTLTGDSKKWALALFVGYALF